MYRKVTHSSDLPQRGTSIEELGVPANVSSTADKMTIDKKLTVGSSPSNIKSKGLENCSGWK